MKRLLASIALCFPICLIAQGFGVFGTDQPFFAKDLAASASAPIVFPHTNQLKYFFVSSDLTNGLVATWPDRITGKTLGQSVTTSYLTNMNGGVYSPNATINDVKSATNTSLDLNYVETPAVLIVTSNAQPIYQAANNYGHFWEHQTTANGFRLFSNSVSSVSWGISIADHEVPSSVILANYAVNIPQGVQAMLFIQTNNYWACYTNRVLSASASGAWTFNYRPYMLGRGAGWANSTTFRGYVMRIIVWTNSITFTAQDITDVFDGVTNIYGHFGP